MAKMVGLNLIIKREWIEKAISLLDEDLSDADYRKELDDYLAYEIESPTNRRKAREILMRVWVRNAEGAEKLQQEGRRLIRKHSDQVTAISWCMIPLAYPIFADYARLMGKMLGFQDTVTTGQIKQKMFDEIGERGLIDTATPKVIYLMKELDAVKTVQTGKHVALKCAVRKEDVAAFMIATAMYLEGSSYYPFNSLSEFPLLFPFDYHISKEYLMQDDRFSLNNFGGDLTVSLNN